MVIPPGIDTSRFSPPGRRKIKAETLGMVDRFLSEPNKPLILTIARPVEGKNLKGLMDAYGTDRALQDMANLAIVAGNKDDIRDLDALEQRVVHVLEMVDNIYGV